MTACDLVLLVPERANPIPVDFWYCSNYLNTAICLKAIAAASNIALGNNLPGAADF
jgi:hypothetical protein